MKPAIRTASEYLREILKGHAASEAGPSEAFKTAGAGLPAGPSKDEVAAAIAKLEDAERNNDASAVLRFLAAGAAALGA